MMHSGVWLKVVGVAAVAALVAVIPFAGIGCKPKETVKPDPWPEGKPKVVVSFAPLYCFAANVAGDDATVRTIMTTKGPHDFDPTATDVEQLTGADLYFTIGLGLDDGSTKKLKDGCRNDKLKVVELGERLPKNKLCAGKCNHGDDEDHPDHDHGIDPHVWLSPDHAILLVELIRDELKAVDPNHAAGYESRAAAYIEKLKKLKTDGVTLLKEKKDRKLVSFHDAMAYFEKAFNLNVKGVLTPKAGQEPDARQMKQLIGICANPNDPVRLIAVEPQYSTSTAGESLRKELTGKVPDVALVEIDTLETAAPADLTPDWYERKMRANLEALSKAMK